MPEPSRPICSFCHQRDAEAFLHDDPTSNAYRVGLYEFICFDCIEAMIERENALAIAPALVALRDANGDVTGLGDMASMLPSIWDA